MKKVFVAGSRKFFVENEEVIKRCKDIKIKAKNAGKTIPANRQTFESESEALRRAFNIIEDSDIVYVVTKNGYVGLTTAVEIGYAYLKKKEIISSEEIENFSIKSLVNEIMNLEEFITYLKESS